MGTLMVTLIAPFLHSFQRRNSLDSGRVHMEDEIIKSLVKKGYVYFLQNTCDVAQRCAHAHTG